MDLTTGGKRERDLRNDFAAPFVPTWRNSRDVLFKPAWLSGMAMRGVPRMKNLEGMLTKAPRLTDVAASVGRELDASFSWEDLKSLRDAWKGKLVLKGIVHPADAERAVAAGCDGIVVSNHGGRQLDGAIATADALPAVARAVNGKLAVLVDGGVRRGIDLLKARALGAQGVLTGRATLFGVMAGGEAGREARHRDPRRRVRALADAVRRAAGRGHHRRPARKSSCIVNGAQPGGGALRREARQQRLPQRRVSPSPHFRGRRGPAELALPASTGSDSPRPASLRPRSGSARRDGGPLRRCRAPRRCERAWRGFTFASYRAACAA